MCSKLYSSVLFFKAVTLIIYHCRCCCFFGYLGSGIPDTRAEKVSLLCCKSIMNRSKQNSVFFNSTRLEEHSLFSSKSVKITSTKTLLSPLFPLSHKGLMHEQFKIVYLKAFIQSTDVKLRKNGHISQCTNWREMETILAMTSRAFKYLLLIKI